MRHPWIVAALAGMACTATDPVDTGGPAGPDDTGGAEAGALADGWWETLTDTGGCSDAVFYARDADATLLLAVTVPGLASDAWAAGGETGLSGTLPDPAITVRLTRGAHLLQPCDDVADPDEATTDAWEAASGTLTAAATPRSDAGPAGEEHPADGYLRLEDVGFESDTAPAATLPALEITAFIGWLPG